MLSDSLPRVLNRATTSDRRKFKLSHLLGDSLAKRIFKAVPNPVTWILPHSRHFSQPTQSMIMDTLRKWFLNSSTTLGLVLLENTTGSKALGHACGRRATEITR